MVNHRMYQEQNENRPCSSKQSSIADAWTALGLGRSRVCANVQALPSNLSLITHHHSLGLHRKEQTAVSVQFWAKRSNSTHCQPKCSKNGFKFPLFVCCTATWQAFNLQVPGPTVGILHLVCHFCCPQACGTGNCAEQRHS